MSPPYSGFFPKQPGKKSNKEQQKSLAEMIADLPPKVPLPSPNEAKETKPKDDQRISVESTVFPPDVPSVTDVTIPFDELAKKAREKPKTEKSKAISEKAKQISKKAKQISKMAKEFSKVAKEYCKMAKEFSEMVPMSFPPIPRNTETKAESPLPFLEGKEFGNDVTLKPFLFPSFSPTPSESTAEKSTDVQVSSSIFGSLSNESKRKTPYSDLFTYRGPLIDGFHGLTKTGLDRFPGSRKIAKKSSDASPISEETKNLAADLGEGEKSNSSKMSSMPTSFGYESTPPPKRTDSGADLGIGCTTLAGVDISRGQVDLKAPASNSTTSATPDHSLD